MFTSYLFHKKVDFSENYVKINLSQCWGILILGSQNMTRKKAENEADFAKKNHIEEQYERAKGVDPKIWTTLQEIKDHYQEYSKLCKAVAQQFLVELMGEREGGCIHSARFRIKEIDSLLVKIIKKKAFLSKEPQENCEEEKYRRLDSKNYFKIVTDISGIRIIIRYREQWQQVHNLIWKYYRLQIRTGKIFFS